IDPTALPCRRTDEEVGVPVAVVVAGERQVPAEVLALRLRVFPELLAGLRRTGDHDASRAALDRRVRRRDDHIREPVAGDVRHRHHPVAEEPIGAISAPVAPDHTMALPLWNVPWSLKRAPAATSAWPSPSTSSGSPKRNPSSPRATSPGKRRARHQPAPGVVQDGMVPAELGSADEQ